VTHQTPVGTLLPVRSQTKEVLPQERMSGREQGRHAGKSFFENPRPTRFYLHAAGMLSNVAQASAAVGILEDSDRTM